MELENVDCLLCGSDEFCELSRQGEHQEYGVRSCRACGFVYLSPRPTAAAINELYDEKYYKDGTRGYYDYEKTFYRYEKLYTKFFYIRESLILRFKEPGTLLEIGCAHGFQLDYLKRQGWDVTGTDVSPVSSGYARNQLNLPVLQGTVKEQSFNSGVFDVVLLIDVLEHMHYPVMELDEIKRILKPDGILLVQVPYELYHWEEYLEALFKGMKPGSITPDALPAHLYFFSPKTLKRFLEQCGFRVLHRASGNYGEVRSRIAPPDLRSGTLPARMLKTLYFRGGIQKIFYYIAKSFKQGNGIIYVAQPR